RVRASLQCVLPACLIPTIDHNLLLASFSQGLSQGSFTLGDRDLITGLTTYDPELRQKMKIVITIEDQPCVLHHVVRTSWPGQQNCAAVLVLLPDYPHRV